MGNDIMNKVIESLPQEEYDKIIEENKRIDAESGNSAGGDGGEGSGSDNDTPKGDDVTTTDPEGNKGSDTDLETGKDPNPEGDDKPSFDLNEFLERSSGGKFRNEEELTSFLDKVKDFDNLSSKIEVLESEKDTIFANDFIKKLNSLHKEGKSQEQIDTFMKLSSLNLDEIDPREALIQDLILNKGNTRAIAENIVDHKYGLSRPDLSLEDKTLDEDEISQRKSEIETIKSIMANDAQDVIGKLKEDLVSIADSVSPERKALEDKARKEAYREMLKPVVSGISKDFPKEVQLEFDDVKMSFPIDEKFLETISADAEVFFNKEDVEVNNENVSAFIDLKKAIIVKENFREWSQKVYEQGKAAGKKESDEAFSNPGGIHPDNITVDENYADIDGAIREIVRKS